MGELKGQLLTILLVLMIFGIMATAFKAMFQSTANEISNRLSEEINAAQKPTFAFFKITFVDQNQG